MCTQRHKTWNFWIFFQKNTFFQFFKKQKWQKRAKPARAWSHRSGILKYYCWLIFWDKKNLKFSEKKNQAKFGKKFLNFFRKFFENFQFSNIHKMAKWAGWIIKNGELQSFEVNKHIFTKIMFQKVFGAKCQIPTNLPKKMPFSTKNFQTRAWCVQALEKISKRPKRTPKAHTFRTHQLWPPSDLSNRRKSILAKRHFGIPPQWKKRGPSF